MVCRMCLLEFVNSMDLFGVEGKRLDIANIVAQHFWFEPKEDDPISTSMCSDCWQQINSFHSFYLRVEEAQDNFSLKTPVEFVAVEEIKAEIEDSLLQNVVDIPTSIQDNHEELTKAVNAPKEIQAGEFGQTSTRSLRRKLRNSSPARSIKSDESEASDLDTQAINNSSDDSSDKSNDKNEKTLTEHAKKSQEIDVLIASFIKLQCEQCQYEGKTFADLKKHCKTTHKVRGHIICCKKKFWLRSYLFDHIKQHLDPQSFKCGECDKTFANKYNLSKHLKDHSVTKTRLYKCDECSKAFHTQTLLSRHKSTHVPVEQRKFFCDECKKPYGSLGLLRQHQRCVHSNEYWNMCDICAKIIRGKKEFEMHQMEHKGIERPRLKCDVCGGLFKSTTALKAHMLLHTDNTEYVCNICGSKTHTKRNLQIHIKRVHYSGYDFKCTICDKSFKRKIKLTEHLTTHTGEKLYNCPYCSKSYTWNANLHEHKRKAHPKEWEECRKKRMNNVNCTNEGTN